MKIGNCRWPVRLFVCLVLPHLLAGSLLAQTPVSVYEDEGGVPHVVGTSDTSVCWALGRQHMLDFPVSTAFHLHYASGGLASLLGIRPGVDEFWLDLDVAHRLWRIPERVAQIHVPRVQADPVLGPLLAAYVAGLNAGRSYWNANPMARDALAFNTVGFPLAAPAIQRLLASPFTPGDVLAWALAWTGFGSRADINRLAGLTGTGSTVGFMASNGWIVSANASASGNPMMLSDPHLPGESPTFFRGTFATLHGPGLEAGGWFIPGLPFPALGFNQDISWTATANGVDHHDVWVANTDSALSYSVGGTPTTIVRSTVTLGFLDLQSGLPGSRTVSLAWADTARDLPILRETLLPAGSTYHSRIVFAGATFVTAGSTLVEFLGQLATASSLGAVQSAIDHQALPEQNLLVLQRNGDMGYWWLARAPVRAAGSPGQATLLGLLDGNNPLHRWGSGVHPAASLPHESYVNAPGAAAEVWINNNVGPEWVRLPPSSTVNPAQFPLGMIVSHPFPTWRQARARQLLAPPVTRAGNTAAALDQTDPWTPTVVPYFTRALQELRQAGLAPPHALTDAALSVLATWSGDADRHSTVAAFAYLLRAKYEQLLQWNALLPVPFPTDPALPSPFTDLPPLGGFSLASDPGDVLAMGIAAQLTVQQLYPGLLNPALQPVALAAPWAGGGPWIPVVDPSPWSTYGPLLELGHVKMLDLTPPGSPPGVGAILPLGGAKDSLFQAGTGELWATLFEGAPGPAGTSSLAINRQSFGTTRLMITEFTPAGPDVSYLAAVGMTEIATDPRRYLPAHHLADRQPQPLLFDVASITSPAHVFRLTQLTMPP